MIKKLYSSNIQKDDKPDSDGDDDKELINTGKSDLLEDVDGLDQDKETRLNKAIVDRQVFSQGYTSGWKFKHFGKKWCCCCRMKPRREDWLQRDAQEKLKLEIDILDIVKRLRVHQFASEVVLKPRQRELVNFFDDYKLKDEADQEISHKIQRKKTAVYGDTKGAGTREIENLEDVLKSPETRIDKVMKAMFNMDQNDPIDSIIIDRITNTKDRTQTRNTGRSAMRTTGIDMNMFIDTVNMARNDVMQRQRTGNLDSHQSDQSEA